MIENANQCMGRCKGLFLPNDTSPSDSNRTPKKVKRRRRISVASRVWEFLESGPANSARIMGSFEMEDVPQIHQAIELVFLGLRKLRATEWCYGDKTNDWGPECQLFDMANGEAKWLMTSGILFCMWTLEIQRLVIIVREDRFSRGERNVLVELIGPPGTQAILKQKFVELRKAIRTLPHFLKGQVVDYHGCPISKSENGITLDDVALPQQTRDLIRKNTIDLLQCREHYASWKIPLTRGRKKGTQLIDLCGGKV